jgi:hypothetical protein
MEKFQITVCEMDMHDLIIKIGASYKGGNGRGTGCSSMVRVIVVKLSGMFIRVKHFEIVHDIVFVIMAYNLYSVDSFKDV